MYRQDITGFIAHAAMLAKQGIISQEDAAQLTEGLSQILADLGSMAEGKKQVQAYLDACLELS